MTPAAIARDGPVIFAKKECPTCNLVQPVIRELAQRAPSIIAFAQDDTALFDGLAVEDDTSLQQSFLHGDPTAEIASELRRRRPALDTLAERCVALRDIGKMRGDEFIGRLEVLMNARGIATRRYKKPTNTRVAPT